jgi:hypothetical protein
MQGLVLGTAIDLSVLSYPVLVIMKKQGQTLGEAEPTPGHRAR